MGAPSSYATPFSSNSIVICFCESGETEGGSCGCFFDFSDREVEEVRIGIVYDFSGSLF